jgi:nondiscriminating glutamyl-tRNA synthetase
LEVAHKEVNNVDNIRVRFAPSPTGPLHIGGARTALFNWLLGRKEGSTMILRVEDTDLERSTKESEINIIRDLRWLGLDWDEGVEIGGEYGPYRQSERLHIYEEFTQRLLAEGKAYFCYCSEEELEEQRQKLLAQGEMPRYTGRCRDLYEEEQLELRKAGRQPVVRFRVPTGETVIVEDEVRGRVEFDSDGIGDFVLVKSDGIPTYNYACVIDDYLMKITHVVRGEEHLSNTPRQVLLYQAFGWTPPKFGHISLILAEDRTKMSKRKGDTSVEQYRDKGYLPEAVVNFLALLGWSPEGEKEIFTAQELAAQFSLERVSRAPAVFDMNKLKWLNSYYIKQSPLKRITDMAIPYLQRAGYLKAEISAHEYAWVEKVVAAVREYISCLSEITEHVDVFFNDEIDFENEAVKDILREEQVPQILNALLGSFEQAELSVAEAKQMIKKIGKDLKLKGQKLYMPIRVALTGKNHGPELDELIAILGKERVEYRVKRAMEILD